MSDLRKRIAAFGTIIKNAGLSAKEASKGFKLFNEAIKDADPIAPANLWTERVLDEAKEATFFQEYMQQPNIEPYETKSTIIATGLTLDENAIDRAREEIKRMAVKEEERITQELLGTFEMPTPDLSTVSTCPHCMRHTTWSFRDNNTRAICNECQWEFDAWALANIEFSEMRNQVLELKLRQQEQELEQSRVQQELESARNHNTPTSPPDNTNMDIADEIRTLMAHRDLSATQVQRLNELIGIVQNSPAPRLQSHPDEYAPEPQQTRLRPLRGQGVSGDNVLMGSEEMLAYDDVDDDGFLTEEMYDGLGFGGDKKKEDPVKPFNPPKRKLDV